MKKILILLAILNCFSITSQERVNSVLPIITGPLKSIDKATGWLINPEGQWISRKNRIPSYLDQNYGILIDSTDYKLGIDNFNFIRKYTVTIDNVESYLIIKSSTNGYFKYKSIRKDWNTYSTYSYWITTKEDFNNIKVLKNKPYLNNIPVTYSGDLDINGTLTNEKISLALVESLKDTFKFSDITYLSINTFYWVKEDVIRFVLFSGLTSKNNITNIENVSGISYKNKIPNDNRKIVASEELFDYFYYEIDKDLFIDTFNIKVE